MVWYIPKWPPSGESWCILINCYHNVSSAGTAIDQAPSPHERQTKLSLRTKQLWFSRASFSYFANSGSVAAAYARRNWLKSSVISVWTSITYVATVTYSSPVRYTALQAGTKSGWRLSVLATTLLFPSTQTILKSNWLHKSNVQT